MRWATQHSKSKGERKFSHSSCSKQLRDTTSACPASSISSALRDKWLRIFSSLHNRSNSRPSPNWEMICYWCNAIWFCDASSVSWSGIAGLFGFSQKRQRWRFSDSLVVGGTDEVHDSRSPYEAWIRGLFRRRFLGWQYPNLPYQRIFQEHYKIHPMYPKTPNRSVSSYPLDCDTACFRLCWINRTFA